MTWIRHCPGGAGPASHGLIYRHSRVGHCGGVKDVVHQPTSRSGVSRCSRPKGLVGHQVAENVFFKRQPQGPQAAAFS
jgi:alkyl sulfatase BDS1-like metallo-beta-lactamase superfamily hydrolase